MSNFKRKRVAAAAFTFLMALSSISGATIANPDLNNTDNQEGTDVTNINTKENPEYSPITLNFTYLNFQNLVEKYNPGLNHTSRDKIFQSVMKASNTYDVPAELI